MLDRDHYTLLAFTSGSYKHCTKCIVLQMVISLTQDLSCCTVCNVYMATMLRSHCTICKARGHMSRTESAPDYIIMLQYTLKRCITVTCVLPHSCLLTIIPLMKHSDQAILGCKYGCMQLQDVTLCMQILPGRNCAEGLGSYCISTTSGLLCPGSAHPLMLPAPQSTQPMWLVRQALHVKYSP